MKHQLLKHDDCQLIHCNICDGGLEYCVKCEGAEGSLPTECPGKPMSDYHESAVVNGVKDFVNGRWFNVRRQAG